MSEDKLVVLNNNESAMQLGGVGIGEGLFRSRPMILEMVQRTSRQEGAIPGQFRVTATNEHLGDKVRLVLLAVPQEQREWYEGADFSRDSKQCFSLDGVQPHDRAKCPPVMYCKTCPKGDINWVTWRKTHKPEDLPPCSAYWHLFVADRQTQMPYFLNVKGKSYMPFKAAMETQMSGLLQKMMINVKLENKNRGYSLVTQQDNGRVYQIFVDTPGFVVPEGQTKQPIVPMPNIFDISFEAFITTTEKGGPFVMGFSKFAALKPEDKAEFGAMYLDFATRKAEFAERAAAEAEAAKEVAEQDAAVAEAPSGPVTGEVVGPEEKITI